MTTFPDILCDIKWNIQCETADSDFIPQPVSLRTYNGIYRNSFFFDVIDWSCYIYIDVSLQMLWDIITS